MRERTRQQLDPVGTSESRLLWVLLAAGSGAYAVAMTISGWTPHTQPWLAILGAALAVVAAALTIAWTAPGRAPFTRLKHLGVHATAVTSMGAIVWSKHPAPLELGDAFGTFVIAGLIVALSPYRPPSEAGAHGAATAILAGFIVLTAVLRSDTTLPALVLVITAVAPILALTTAAATYTESLIRAIEKTGARRHAPAEADTRAHRDRVGVMTRDAMPLLQRVLERGSITSADRADAKATAQSLRSMLVEEANRTWLDAAQDNSAGPRFTVTDPDALASELTATRRTVLRALLDSLASEPGFTGGDVTLTRGPIRNHLRIGATFNADEYTTPPGHPVVSALLTVMRSVFTELDTSRTQTRVLVTFGYERE